jgi:hypothetical protein
MSWAGSSSRGGLPEQRPAGLGERASTGMPYVRRGKGPAARRHGAGWSSVLLLSDKLCESSEPVAWPRQRSSVLRGMLGCEESRDAHEPGREFSVQERGEAVPRRRRAWARLRRRRIRQVGRAGTRASAFGAGPGCWVAVSPADKSSSRGPRRSCGPKRTGQMRRRCRTQQSIVRAS